MWYRATLIAIGLAWCLAGVRNTPASQPIVIVKNGSYAGIHSETYNQDWFLGIPYAQPPIKDLRFRVPRHLEDSWVGPRDAKRYSPACVGYGGDEVHYDRLSEDCLYLNVLRPAGYGNNKLPVAFWMHGGGFFQGSTMDKRYNLCFIIQQSVEIGKPMIGVSINYRISAWGFLLGKEVQDSGQSNLGLRDQRLAMQWVQENINAFGGDSNKVTVWGESAGASSVGNHIIAYNGRDDKLFRAGIMQSGGPIFYYPMTAKQSYFDLLLSSVGCDTSKDKIQCLRTLPFSVLNAAINTTEDLTQRWHPVVDGDLITKRPSKLLAADIFNKVPVIVGANSDEGSIFSPRQVNTEEDFYNHLIHNSSFTPFFAAKIPSGFATRVLKVYPDIPELGIPGPPTLAYNVRPAPRFGAQFRRSSAYYGDAIFVAPRRQTCAVWASSGVPAYCYRFNTIPAGVPPEIASTHFQEIAFVMQNRIDGGQGYYMPPVPPFMGKPDSFTSLSKVMGKSWISFVVDLDPNSWKKTNRDDWWKPGPKGPREDTPIWPQYQLDTPLDIVWDANVTALAFLEKDTYRGEAMELINSAAATVFDR
ncbi:Alpha/Beta hydrolase protein [Amylocarpus encephaloides]|uniref:Carboxylic ester hydrolase n=1 Tax=Amylocarpus encephaloides TaxID=45428 RepID=A0A9P7YCV7_9HELO|nr:Alpha/Beta hydrolase protein [Amylocarpus encephaloides]